MPVYRKHKAIHIHIPKTGGTSIEKYFGQQFNIRNSNPQFLWGHDRSRKLVMHHLSCQQILDLNYLDRKTFDDFFKFAIVRNPYDRLVSEYHWSPAWREKYPRFYQFIAALPENIKETHLIPQYQFVCDQDNKIMVDQVIKQENYQKEVGEMMKSRFNINANTGKHYNSRAHKPWRSYFGRPEFDIVNKIYQKDFEMFGYEMC